MSGDGRFANLLGEAFIAYAQTLDFIRTSTWADHDPFTCEFGFEGREDVPGLRLVRHFEHMAIKLPPAARPGAFALGNDLQQMVLRRQDIFESMYSVWSLADADHQNVPRARLEEGAMSGQFEEVEVLMDETLEDFVHRCRSCLREFVAVIGPHSDVFTAL